MFLDYDGTLSAFFKNPEDARPGPQILKMLKKLDQDPQNTVVIISGRDKSVLQNWFGSLNLDLAAGHGVWIRSGKDQWKKYFPTSNTWKKEIVPLYQHYVDNTPGTFIEEKEVADQQFIYRQSRRPGPSTECVQARAVPSRRRYGRRVSVIDR